MSKRKRETAWMMWTPFRDSGMQNVDVTKCPQEAAASQTEPDKGKVSHIHVSRLFSRNFIQL